MSQENKIQNLFNSISADYDKLNNVISLNQHKLWRNKTMKHMHLKNEDIILDLCCGTGDWSIQMAEENDKVEVVGVDFSENMLEVAKHRTAHLKNISLMQGDAMNLDFPDASFDFVTIGFGLRNLPDYALGLREMYRVLKPGGTLVILETSQPKNNFIRLGFNFYFGNIMPKLGGLLVGKEEEYKWLYESTRNFPSKEKLSRMIKQTGFTFVKCLSHTLGTAATHIATKPLEKELGQ